MNRSHLWKLFLVLFVVGWSIYELTPPTGRDLLEAFQNRARNRDAAFSEIVATTQRLNQEMPARTFANLKDAVGTNDLTRYFPQYDVRAEKDPNSAILHRIQQAAAGKLRLGLDLQGGMSFLVAMDTNVLASAEERDKEVALNHAVEVLRKRVDRLGVAEPVIQPAGSDRILIQLPGLSEADKETAMRQIERAAFLEFRLVHPNSVALLQDGIIDPEYEVKSYVITGEDGQKRTTRVLVTKKPARGLTGKYLKRAFVSRHQLTNKPEIQFELDSEGAALFGQVTRENEGRQLAIVLDGELYSAPVINEPIEGGRGVITGTFDPAEAQELANVLENPLEAPVEIIQQSTVDPSLGKDSIRSGMRAVIIGMLAVASFMLVYYLFAGLVANVALTLNMVILLGVLCAFEATLTLPGIAGIVLTIGMAVDSNVLIFERIREELKAGKSMRGAVNAGYSKAFGTIFDSNITTLISGIILIFMGTGPVQGFGVTLSIGIVTSMFTALVATRLIFDFFLAKGWLKNLRMLHIIRGANLDFLRWAPIAFVASWVLIGIGIGWGINRGKDILGVEFSGGDTVVLDFAQKVPTEQLRETIGRLGVGDVVIQYQREITGEQETLRVTTRSIPGGPRPETEIETSASERVVNALTERFPEAKFTLLSEEQVGAVVGKEIQKTAIVATLLALFGILIYVAFRYELSFAVAAVVAILHDVLMTMGWFFLTGRELSAPMVAAVLTIIGFSINDTIVIFDRVREDLRLGVRGTFKEVINRALNQTLARTIITSGTTFLTALSLYVFGGGVINDFAFTFLVGVLTGTYSTIYIAGAIVLWWHKGERPKTGSGVIMDSTVTARA